MFTDEQLEAILRMQDIGGEEAKRVRQMQQVNQLRSGGMGMSSAGRGMDWASQLSRGIQGAGAGYGAMQTEKSAAESSTAKQDLLNQLFGKKKRPSVSTPTNPTYGAEEYQP